jgi:hypothetical protein
MAVSFRLDGARRRAMTEQTPRWERFPMIELRHSLSFANPDQDCFENRWIQFLSQISLFD